MIRLNVVDEAHRALKEIGKTRTDFSSGNLQIDQAKVFIGLFNATSRSIQMAINSERWYKAKQSHKPIKE